MMGKRSNFPIEPAKSPKTPKNQDKKNQQTQIIYWLLGCLFFLTALVTTHYFRVSMTALVTFVLAYLTKGIRRRGIH
jgi:hypothetical protein